MQRKNRLTGGKRFSQIHEQGGNAANRLLVIRFLANDSGCSRFGFLVNKRIGNAVVRNRVKRRLREAVRLSQVKPGWDALFIVRRGAGTAKYQELKDATDNLLRRADLVERSPKPIGVSPSGSLSSESPSTGSPSAGSLSAGSLSAADKPNSPPSN